MEPKLPSPDRGPEILSVDGGEYGDTLTPNGGEVNRQLSERREQRGETPVSAESIHTPPPILPMPAQPVADDTTGTTLPQISDDTPATAANNDVIEKEWVDSAKKIVAETRDDPYQREQKVKELQKAYLDKRYGKTLGAERQ